MALCRYGREFKVLKTLLASDIEIQFKYGILKNHAFVRHGGAGDRLKEYRLTRYDIMALYDREQNSESRLFEGLFLNSALEPDFLCEIFDKKSHYDRISDKDLWTIFELLHVEKSYFSRNAEKYKENSYANNW